jgi:hypothetical protein
VAARGKVREEKGYEGEDYKFKNKERDRRVG